MAVSPGHFGVSGFIYPWVGIPSAGQVATGVTFGANNALTGTLDPGGGGTVPAAGDVRLGVATGVTTGTLVVPVRTQVLSGVATDNTTGTLTLPTAAQVLSAVTFGVGGTGSTGTVVLPSAASVLSTVTFGPSSGTAGTYVAVPAASVKTGVTFGAASAQTGTYDGSDRWSDPGVSHVESGVQYKANSTSNNRTGTLNPGSGGPSTDPGASNVRVGVTYTIGSVDYTGTLEVPDESDVRVGVGYGAGGTEFAGTLLVTGATVLATSPVHPTTRRLRLNAGDDYDSSDGVMVPSWNSEAWPDLTGASVAFVAYRVGRDDVNVAAELTSVGGASQVVSLDPLTADQTDELVGYRLYEVIATLPNGNVVTIVPASGLSVT